jgi:hypothetical protein
LAGLVARRLQAFTRFDQALTRWHRHAVCSATLLALGTVLGDGNVTQALQKERGPLRQISTFNLFLVLKFF